MCDCVNQSMGFLSERMVNVIVQANGDEAIMQAELEKYVEEDLEAAMKDVEVLQGSMIDDMTNCFDRVADDYEDVYTDDSDEQIEVKIIAAMEELDGCETSVAFFRLGMAAQEESTEPTSGNSIGETPMEDEIDEFLFMADDLCICVNELTIPLSERMVGIFEDSRGDKVKVEEMAAEYAADDEESAMNDSQLMKSMDADIELCLSRAESDYDYLFEQESEEVIRERILYYLDEIEGCQVAYGIMNLYFTLEK